MYYNIYRSTTRTTHHHSLISIVEHSVEKTTRIAAERREKLLAECSANANHNAWLEKKIGINLLELQQQTEESEREKAEEARKKERQTAANHLESE